MKEFWNRIIPKNMNIIDSSLIELHEHDNWSLSLASISCQGMQGDFFFFSKRYLNSATFQRSDDNKRFCCKHSAPTVLLLTLTPFSNFQKDVATLFWSLESLNQLTRESLILHLCLQHSCLPRHHRQGNVLESLWTYRVPESPAGKPKLPDKSIALWFGECHPMCHAWLGYSLSRANFLNRHACPKITTSMGATEPELL